MADLTKEQLMTAASRAQEIDEAKRLIEFSIPRMLDHFKLAEQGIFNAGLLAGNVPGSLGAAALMKTWQQVAGHVGEMMMERGRIEARQDPNALPMDLLDFIQKSVRSSLQLAPPKEKPAILRVTR